MNVRNLGYLRRARSSPSLSSVLMYIVRDSLVDKKNRSADESQAANLLDELPRREEIIIVSGTRYEREQRFVTDLDSPSETRQLKSRSWPRLKREGPFDLVEVNWRTR